MTDAELVRRKMALILQDLALLAPFGSTPLPDYLASPTDELVVERLLERMIGRMIDINFHLATEAGSAPPRDYFDSFLRLAPLGVLDADFARRIAACTGLRNRIAHEYDELDPRRVHAAVGDALVDIPEYLRHIERFISA